MASHRLIVGVGGEVRAVHSDTLQKTLSKLGELQLSRASRVDPGSELPEAAKDWLASRGVPLVLDKWYAVMLVGSKQVLGPFESHAQAIQAEQEILRQENIPLS